MTATTIAAIGSAGDGIAETHAGRVYVPYAITGETVEIKPPQLLSPSPARRPPPCPHHGDVGRPGCGGCRMQHLAEDAYAAWKTGLVTEALRHARVKHPRPDPIAISPPFSRRRASLTMERRGARNAIGFTRRGSHDIVDLETCLILDPALFALLEPLRRLDLVRPRERADVVLSTVGGEIDAVIERRRPLNLADREALAAFAAEHNLARISWRAGPRQQAEPVMHARSIRAEFGGYPVGIPPGSFLQATAEGQAAMTDFAHAVLPAGPVIDLFAGCGTFSFPALRCRPVHAVETSREACQAMRNTDANGLTIEQRDLFTDPIAGFDEYAAAIIDPPHAGADAQCRALAAAGPAIVVAMSCNPGSFARDAATLCDGGYRLQRILPVDQFLWSAEVEIAALFKRAG